MPWQHDSRVNLPKAYQHSIIFILFVVAGDTDAHRHTGIVTEARILRDDGLLRASEESQLNAVFAWLNANLPCPPFSSAGWSQDAVTWIKDSSTESIRQCRKLTALLQRHERPVRTLKSPAIWPP